MPSLLAQNGINIELVDGETEFDEALFTRFNSQSASEIVNVGKYSYEIQNYKPLWARVDLLDSPRIAPGEKRQVKVQLFNRFNNAKRLKLELFLPKGWSGTLSQNSVMLEMMLNHNELHPGPTVTIDIEAGEDIDDVNFAYLQVSGQLFVQPVMIPIVFVG